MRYIDSASRNTSDVLGDWLASFNPQAVDALRWQTGYFSADGLAPLVEEVSGAVIEVMLDTDIPAATQLLSPRNYMNNGATAAAVAYDCSGVYVETDY